jgi:SAM-dependent methyltransferase
VFVGAVREALATRRQRGAPVTALDIGCGWGIGEDPFEGPGFLQGIRDAADHLIGLDPDLAVRPSHGLLDSLVHATMEDAQLPPAFVDVAYAYYVLEHVPDAARFLRAVARILKPGGVFLAMTPHGRHWFSRTSRLLGRLRMDGPVLRLVRGAQAADAYHYPVSGGLHDPRLLPALAMRAGFPVTRMATFDHGDVLPYLPGGVRRLYDRWSRHHEGQGRQELVCLLVRLERSHDAHALSPDFKEPNK